MHSISASYTDKCLTSADPPGTRQCPICQSVFAAGDIFETFLEGSETRVDCCPNCMNDFAADCDIRIEEDVVTADVFRALHRWATENMQAPDKDRAAQAAAEYFGAEAWNSGGGIVLLLIDRDDGSVCCISGDCIAVHRSRESMERGDPPLEAISFRK